MSVTIKLGHGLTETTLEEIQSLLGQEKRPGEDDAAYEEYLVDNWSALNPPRESMSMVETHYFSGSDGDIPWFPRSRDGMNLDTTHILHDKPIADPNFSYGGYSRFRATLLEAIADAIPTSGTKTDRPSPDVIASGNAFNPEPPTEQLDISEINGAPGGMLARNIGQRPGFHLPRELRPLWRTFNDDDTAFRPERLVDLGLSDKDSNLDPYTIVPFADLLNFGDDRGLIGPEAVERLNLSMDWLEAKTLEAPKGSVDGIQRVINSSATVASLFQGIRDIRNHPGAFMIFS